MGFVWLCVVWVLCGCVCGGVWGLYDYVWFGVGFVWLCVVWCVEFAWSCVVWCGVCVVACGMLVVGIFFE